MGKNQTSVLVACAFTVLLGDSGTAQSATYNASDEASLRSAIASANNNLGPDTIYLSSATPIILSTSGPGEDASATGDLDITDSTGRLHIIGDGMASTTIGYSSAIQGDRLIHIHPGASLKIEGIFLDATKSYSTGVPGDAIRNDGGDVVIDACTVLGSSSDNQCGGIYNGVNGILTIRGSLLDSNWGPDTYGGAVYNLGRLEIYTSDLVDNEADGYYGGGIYNVGGYVYCEDTVFSGNHAYYGGGMYTQGGTVELWDCTFTLNTSGGGGALVNDDASVTGSNCLFDSNSGSQAGAIWARPASNGRSSFVFTGSTFSNNSASAAGGIYATSSASSNASSYLRLDDTCVVEHNSADQMGGGIATSGSLVEIEMKPLTAVRFNSAGILGGGIWNGGGDATITGGHIHDNTPDDVSNY